MNQDKRLISIFKTFIQKSLLPQIKKYDGNLQQWNRFSNLLNNQPTNLNQLQNYVDTLPNSIHNNQRKELSLTGRKKQQPKGYPEPENLNINKSFGGQKSKNIVAGLRLAETENRYDPKTQNYKQISTPKELNHAKDFNPPRDDSFRRGNIPSSVQAMGNSSPQALYQPVNVVSSLQRLLKNLQQNQQRIEMIQSKNF